MGRSNFVNKLDGLHKGALEILLPAAGLKIRDERILKLWYINEASIYEIAADLRVTKESAYNLLSAARCRLEKILTTLPAAIAGRVPGYNQIFAGLNFFCACCCRTVRGRGLIKVSVNFCGIVLYGPSAPYYKKETL